MGSRLEHVIARNVAELRADRGMTQADLAKEMRHRGFTWSPNRAAQIETLYRTVSLLEVIGLTWVFRVQVKRLLAGNDEITLPDGSELPLAFLRDEALAGRTPTWESRRPTKQDYDEDRLHLEELRKLAAKVGLKAPVDLERIAHQVFGQGFVFEREDRLGDVKGLSKRSAQTKRGHVSRALLAELDDYLGEGEDRAAKLDELHADDDAVETSEP
jgi:transcriptional regulator with XRE-family HTH domain